MLSIPRGLTPAGCEPAQDLAPALGRLGDEPREQGGVEERVEVDVGDQQELARAVLRDRTDRGKAKEQDRQCDADRLAETGNYERASQGSR